MASVIIDRSGYKRYYNDRGILHRVDGPAIIHPSGWRKWYVNGFEDQNRPNEFRKDGVVFAHRTSETIKLGVDCPDGYKSWTNRQGSPQWPKL